MAGNRCNIFGERIYRNYPCLRNYVYPDWRYQPNVSPPIVPIREIFAFAFLFLFARIILSRNARTRRLILSLFCPYTRSCLRHRPNYIYLSYLHHAIFPLKTIINKANGRNASRVYRNDRMDVIVCVHVPSR